MDRETFNRLRNKEVKETQSQIKKLEGDLASKNQEISDLQILKSLNEGVDPYQDPEIKEAWNSFSPKERDAAHAIARELDKIMKAGGDPQKAMRELIHQVKNIEDAAKKIPHDRLRIFKRALDKGLPMHRSEIVQVGGNYEIQHEIGTAKLSVEDARICFLPDPMPAPWEPGAYILTGKPLPPEWASLEEEDFLGLPFEKIWIESKSVEGITNVLMTSPADKNTEMVFIGGLLTTEVIDGSPRLIVQAVTVANKIEGGVKKETRVTTVKYGITNHLIHWMNLIMMSQENLPDRVLKFPEDDNSGVAFGLLCPSFYTVIGFMLSIKNKEVRMGSERVNERVKVGSGKDRHLHKIKQVVHVALHVEGNTLPSKSAQGGEIDWSHRWEVMGHWRRVPGIGKSPSGEYGIKGFTWVNPHERGPENKPVIKKIRIIEQ
jgi:hypothetical protein